MATELSESEIKRSIERLEIDARHIRRVIEHQPNEGGKRVLNQQLTEIREQLESLAQQLPAAMPR